METSTATDVDKIGITKLTGDMASLKSAMKRKFDELGDGGIPCVRNSKEKSRTSVPNFSFLSTKNGIAAAAPTGSSDRCSRYRYTTTSSQRVLTQISNHIYILSDIFIFAYICLTVLDCLLRLTRLNHISQVNREKEGMEIAYLRRCVAALYTGLGISMIKFGTQSQLDDALQRHKLPVPKSYWTRVLLASISTLMFCERRIRFLGLSEETSILQVGLWQFLWPYQWIKRSLFRTYFSIVIYTFTAIYLSLRDIFQLRLHFLRLWSYVPLPIMNLQTATMGTKQLLTHGLRMPFYMVVFVLIFLALVSFLGWVRGFFDMFHTLVFREAGESGVLGTEYEQIVFTAGSVLIIAIRVADWVFYKRGRNQYQGNIVETVEFAIQQQTQLEERSTEPLPRRELREGLRSDAENPRKRVCLQHPQEEATDSTSTYSTYQHVPLYHPEILKQLSSYKEGMDMIRILVVHPSRNYKSKIICSLYHVPIGDICGIYYDALSYCWGNQPTSYDIEINNANFPVTPNLHSALLRLRYGNIPRQLWVDAICINQGSDEKAIQERNYQVSIMRKIYRCCESVRVWLGEEAHESDVALNLISQLSKAYTEQNNAAKEQFIEHSNRGVVTGVPPMYDHAYTSLVHLMRRVYFQRVWIIQEVALAPDALIFCGSSMIQPTWNELENAFNFASQLGALNIYRQLLPQNFIALQTSRQAIAISDGNNRKLSVLLSRHRPSMATNPRDKVYALLGLCDERELSELGVNIDYSLPIGELFMIVAKKIIQKERNLDLLSATVLSKLHTSELKDIPSWVPDWTLPDPPRAIRYNGLNTPENCLFKATSDHEYELEIEDDNSLVVMGQTIDEISEVGMVYSGYLTSNLHSLFSYFPLFCDEVRVLSNWRTIAGTGSGAKYFTGENVIDIYPQVINGGLKPNMSKPNNDIEVYIRFFEYLHVLRLDSFEFIYRLFMALLLLFMAFLALGNNLVGLKQREQMLGDDDLLRTYRRIFRTRKGYVGLGNREAGVGDWVVLVKGARVPLVFRWDGERGVWRANGDCYLHGFMGGEEFREKECVRMKVF